MAQPQIYEGTAEEIAAQLRASQLTGRLKVIVTPEEILLSHGDAPNPADALADFLADADRTEFVPGQPLANPQERELGRLVAAKFAQHGHTKS